MNNHAVNEPESSAIEFCALGYRFSADGDNASKVLVFIFRFSQGDVSIRFDPDWRSNVDESIREYVGSLLEDLRERALSDPDALMRQVSSLNVGPIVTHSTGKNIAEFPELDQLCRRFVEKE